MDTDIDYVPARRINFCVCVMEVHFIDNFIRLERVHVRLKMGTRFLFAPRSFLQCVFHIITIFRATLITI